MSNTKQDWCPGKAPHQEHQTIFISIAGNDTQISKGPTWIHTIKVPETNI
jgi:hypothetical protein